MTWTDDHGEDGLRRKFDVYKPRDGRCYTRGSGRTSYPDDKRIGADGEFIFVLRPETDEAAFFAMSEYAHEVEHRAPQLAKDIWVELRRIRGENQDA